MEYILAFASYPDQVFKSALYGVKAFLLHVRDHFVPHARNHYHPHILGHRALALFSALLVSLKIFTLALLTFGPVLPAYSSAITPVNIISLTNQSREQYGLKDLSQNALLAKAAQAKADDMLARGYFAHNTPDGRTPWSFITAAGYNYLEAGENLAVNFTEAENVETAWMNSPGHKANILNKDFEEIGIGVSEGQYQGHTAIFVVQEFGTPAEQQIHVSNVPTPVQVGSVPAPKVVAANPPAKAAPRATSLKPAAIVPVPASPITAAAPEPVKILTSDVKLLGDNAELTAQTNQSAYKVVAFYGEHAIMLSPRAGNNWDAQVPISVVAEAGGSVRLRAYDIRGSEDTVLLADFTKTTMANFSVLGETAASPQVKTSFFGHIFDPRNFEQKFYLFFIAGLLTSLVIAIAVRRHIQHLSLIANTSFVVVLALMLWMG